MSEGSASSSVAPTVPVEAAPPVASPPSVSAVHNHPQEKAVDGRDHTSVDTSQVKSSPATELTSEVPASTPGGAVEASSTETADATLPKPTERQDSHTSVAATPALSREGSTQSRSLGGTKPKVECVDVGKGQWTRTYISDCLQIVPGIIAWHY